jgi:hypothetical protein
MRDLILAAREVFARKPTGAKRADRETLHAILKKEHAGRIEKTSLILRNHSNEEEHPST